MILHPPLPFRRALVTGATGFIGRVLCRRLGELEVAVTATARHEAEGPWDRFLPLDLGEDPAAPLPPELWEGVDVVFHLAGKAHALEERPGEEEESYFRIHRDGTARLAAAAREQGVDRFILFSSVKAMGEGGEDEQDESAPCQPVTPYGRSKWEAEPIVLKAGFPHATVLRLSMVYGPGAMGNLPRMMEAIRRHRFPPLPPLDNRRSMIHVEDVADAAILAASLRKARGKTYLLTDGQDYSTRLIYEWMLLALGREIPRWYVSHGLLKFAARLGDHLGRATGRRMPLDSDQLRKLFGSAWYANGRICHELDFTPQWNLMNTLKEMARELEPRR
ncbi:MAG: NAD-dependent epimerase/dehydratase family protein [Magnetococcales bacterium]|nr:NAD-dependent epimerase/dehydratase family protein [Magnetococcales bacterium]